MPATPAPPAPRRVGLLLAAFAAATFGAVHFFPRVPQDPAYHDYADVRSCCGVPNTADVVSNAPFLVVGLLGLAACRRGGRARFVDDRERAPWRTFFVGVTLTAFGSTWYHLAPTNASLAWDRLPMTVAFCGLVAALLAERFGPRVGTRALAPLLLFGAASVAWWRFTESRGEGDLRWYGFVQFFPILFAPALWASTRPRYDRLKDFGVAALWYGAAKALELGDRAVFEALGGVVSGHTLKHLAAALACAAFVTHLVRRRPVAGGSPAETAVRTVAATSPR
ncbi:MAG TPA: alkaline phytoceramidase [Planctomycetota bacterium]|nr:alkaline phytoceramidase [Planctomycetota bacterium]